MQSYFRAHEPTFPIVTRAALRLEQVLACHYGGYCLPSSEVRVLHTQWSRRRSELRTSWLVQLETVLCEVRRCQAHNSAACCWGPSHSAPSPGTGGARAVRQERLPKLSHTPATHRPGLSPGSSLHLRQVCFLRILAGCQAACGVRASAESPQVLHNATGTWKFGEEYVVSSGPQAGSTPWN